MSIAGAAFEVGLGFVIEAYDWVRAKFEGLPFVSGRGRGGAGGDYEPLGTSGDGLELDPEDHRSPPLFPGSMQP